jgi:mannose-1-phosphate guanylyltransferase/phosphomannomutase
MTAGQFSKAATQLSSIVRSVDADMGFLLDSGGEKIFLVDDAGEIIDGDTALNIVTLLTLKCAKAAKSKGGAIAVPVTASRGVDIIAKNYGFDVLRTKTTPRGLMEAAGVDGVAFVGEASGGYIFPQFQPNFDGMYAIAKILEMLAVLDVKLHKLARELPPSIIIKDRVPCSFEHKGLIMRRLAEDSNPSNTTLLDGIRIDFKTDWVAAYPSQDSPYFIIVAEAPTEHGAKSLIAEYSEKIRAWQK